jgi:hypothetical protein
MFAMVMILNVNHILAEKNFARRDIRRDFKMGDFKYQQKERLLVEQGVKYWAERYNKIQNPMLKKIVDSRVENLINSYETQLQCLEYHLNRYERLKKNGV